MREKILYIHYRACEGKDFFIIKNRMQYENAVGLISVNIILHVLQLGGLIVFFKDVDIMPVTEFHLLALLLIVVASIFFVRKLFAKRILAKAIAKYKNNKIRNCRLIAFGYLAFNLTLTILLYLISPTFFFLPQ